MIDVEELNLLAYRKAECDWVHDYYEFELGVYVFRVVFFSFNRRIVWWLYTDGTPLPAHEPYTGASIAHWYTDTVRGAKRQSERVARHYLIAKGLS